MQAAQDNNVSFVDLLPSLQSQASSDLWVTPPDPHPNAFANELIAAGLFSALQKLNAAAATEPHQDAGLPVTVQ